MSRRVLSGLMLGVVALVGSLSYYSGLSVGAEQPKKSRLFEMRTYTCNEGKLDALHARFRDHTIKLFAKHGITNHMYWIPTDEKLSKTTLIYVISHDSEESAKASWDAFRKDPEWIKVRAESEKDGPILSKVETRYMTLADYSPVK